MGQRETYVDALGRVAPSRRGRGLSDADRFALIGWQVDSNGCWNWNGYRNPKGYGKFPYSGGQMAHRFSLELKLGRRLSDGMECLHRCNNKSCVNPAHLEEGTHLKNMQDATMDGRLGHARLKPHDIPEIRRRVRSGESRSSVAADFSITREAISRIMQGKNWAWVPEEKEEE